MNAPTRLVLEEMTSQEIELEIERNTPIILPVGSIEQHGPHLPLGTDAFLAQQIASRVATECGLIIAPVIFYAAYSRPRYGGGRHFPGSTGLPGRVVEQIITDVVSDWVRQGFRRVLVLNGHFENAWSVLEGLERAAETPANPPKLLTMGWWDLLSDSEARAILGPDFPGWAAEHASITETAMMQFLKPELVREELITDGGAERVIAYDIIPAPGDILWPNGIGHKALPASAAKGEELVELITERLAAIVRAEY